MYFLRNAFCFLFIVQISILTLSQKAIAAEPNDSALVPIGSRISAFELTDFRGRKWSSQELAASKNLVVVFLGTQCPLAKLYTQRINQLAEQFASQGIVFVAVNPNVQDSLEMMSAFAKKHHLDMPFLKDPDQSLATAIGATRTPEVCVISHEGRLVYRGRIDDQYGIGYTREQPEKSELRDAITALLAGNAISTPETTAVGCLIGRRRPTDNAGGDVTYANQISRLLQRRCVECHHAGDIGPMDLSQYEDVVAWSDMMLEVIRDNRMPPWHATHDHLKFANDRSLTAEERSLFEKWVSAGTPQGEMADLPEPLTYIDGWQLPQEPDVIIPVSSQPFTVPAKGEVRYQYFQQTLDFDEEKWIKAVEVKPGNRAVVHHILVFDRLKGTDGNIQGVRSFFAGYVPGTRVQPYPKGMARRLPAGSELVFQVHYTSVGTDQLDQSHIGMVFEDDPSSLTHEIQTTSVFNPQIRIPPGDANFSITAESDQPLPACDLLAMSPHMHVRGKSFRYIAKLPDGTQTTLLDVPSYDFNWQTDYSLSERMPLPAGTIIRGEAVYDNSPGNLNNPDPTQWVRFGEQTWDEMMIGYFHVAVPLDAQTKQAMASVLPKDQPARRRAPVQEAFKRLDKDGDGRLSKDEIPAKYRLFSAALDKNNDGFIELSEFRLPN